MPELPWVYLSAESDPWEVALEKAAVALEEKGFELRMRSKAETAEEVVDSMEQAYAWVYLGSDRLSHEADHRMTAGSVLQLEMEAAAGLGLPWIHLVPVDIYLPREEAAAPGNPLWTGKYEFVAGDEKSLQEAMQMAAKALAADLDGILNPVRCSLPPPVACFTGRQAEVAWLADRLSQARPGDAISLIGPGGTGKTAIAREAMEQVADQFPGGVFMHDFYAAPTRRAFEDSILGMEHGDCAADLREDIVNNLLSGGRALVYLEGMEKLRENERGDLVNNILSACGRAVVLLTSRNPFDAWQTKSLEISVMPLEEAALLLQGHARNRAGGGRPEGHFAVLADLLGRQPLALTVAGSLMKHAGESPEDYVWGLRQAGMDRLPEGQRPVDALRYLFHRQAMALPMPAREAWFAISLHGICLTCSEMLAASLGLEKTAIAPLMQLLEERGIVTKEVLPRQQGYPEELAWRLAHALMADWGRARLGDSAVDIEGITGRWQEYWATLWEEEYRCRLVGGDGAWHAFICAHLRTYLIHLEGRLGESEGLLKALRRCGQLYQMMGRLVEGLPFSRREVALATRLHGPDHPETLEAMSELAWFLADTDRGTGVGMSEQILSAVISRDGPGHPVACNARLILAAILFLRDNRHDDKRAVKLLQENIILARQDHSGKSDKSLLESLVQLGWHLHNKQKPEALAHFREALQLFPDDNHPELRLRPDFIEAGAWLTCDEGELGDALAFYRRAESVYERIAFSTEGIWTVRGAIADLLAALEHWEEAEAVALQRWAWSKSFYQGALFQREAREQLAEIRSRRLGGECTPGDGGLV